MKKRSFAIMFALVMFAAVYALPLYAQNSQSIGVTVPFDFLANGKTLPAGTYRIEPADDNRLLWSIRGLDRQSGSFLLASMRDGSPDGKIVVTFHRYGDRNFLAGFKTASYDITLAATSAEKSVRVANGPLSKMEVVEVESANATSGSANRR